MICLCCIASGVDIRFESASYLFLLFCVQFVLSRPNVALVSYSFFFFFFFFLLAPGLLSAGPTMGEGGYHPFRRSRSHLEEADDTGTPPAVTEAGFERMTLVLRDMCLTHSTTAAHSFSSPLITRISKNNSL